ncbi:MAG: hypothetical protein HXY24_01860 [Rubrivivax sp.]|nr:hypothetical protein [Rubrivivax sp.]
MTNREGASFVDPPAWDPPPHTVQFEQRAHPTGEGPVVLLLHHPLDPFVVAIEDSGDRSLQAAARAYLNALERLHVDGRSVRSRLPAEWIDALAGEARREDDGPLTAFGWMPVDWPPTSPEQAAQQPAGSMRIGPADGDHAVVLFASERLDSSRFRGSGFGLRIVLRLRRPEPDGRIEASVTSFAASLPFGVWSRPVAAADLADLPQWLSTWSTERRDDVVRGLAQVAGLDERTIGLTGLRLARPTEDSWAIEVRGVGSRPGGGTMLYAYTALADEAGRTSLLHCTPLVADAVPGDARVFDKDPASSSSTLAVRERRPTRDEATLETFRVNETIAAGHAKAPLVHGSELAVQPCARFVREDRGRTAPPAFDLPGTGPPVCSDTAAAVQGFRHGRELLERLRAYGLPPQQYFRVAQSRIDVMYRSGVAPGPGKGGRTVNARVLPKGWRPDDFGSTPPGQRPALELHLGLATLVRRCREPWDGTEPARAAAMGIAADARWMWHEFGHVLLMATTGELELRFAHSPGDALAAIVADPESSIEQHGEHWRYQTFPWVLLPRRHDRSVVAGWGWEGPMHAELAGVPDALQPRRKGYRSEQILSSTLFRLYRCLGGDTVEDGDSARSNRVERRRASHYTLYLLLQSLRLLGDARIVPARRPEQLAQALMLADTTLTSEWDITFPIGSTAATDRFRRIGGCAHKAVRWAFEAQGLYALPGHDGHSPGAPPAVDVYIASRRPEGEATPYGPVDYGPGSYVPVSLHWQGAVPGDVPMWQARDDAIEIGGQAGEIRVRVGNRGRHVATGVDVDVWWAPWPPNTPPPQWNEASWTACQGPGPSAQQDIEARATATFGPFQLASTTGQRIVVLARATCAGDRSNIDAGSPLACASQLCRLDDLVAHDNNLGLRVVT